MQLKSSPIAMTYDRDILTNIFERKGGDGTSLRLWKVLDPQIKHELEPRCNLHEGEQLILGQFIDAENWLALTDRNIFWCAGGPPCEVALAHIQHARADLKMIGLERIRNSTLNSIVLDTFDGMQHVLRVEAGKPHNGLLNLLMNCAAKNKSALE